MTADQHTFSQRSQPRRDNKLTNLAAWIASAVRVPCRFVSVTLAGWRATSRSMHAVAHRRSSTALTCSFRFGFAARRVVGTLHGVDGHFRCRGSECRVRTLIFACRLSRALSIPMPPFRAQLRAGFLLCPGQRISPDCLGMSEKLPIAEMPKGQLRTRGRAQIASPNRRLSFSIA